MTAHPLSACLTAKGRILGLAIDHGRALDAAIALARGGPARPDDALVFKSAVVSGLAAVASVTLVDSTLGPVIRSNLPGIGPLMFGYEQDTYGQDGATMVPKLPPGWSVRRLVEIGARAIKLFLYVDTESHTALDEQRKVMVERVGAECAAAGVPFFLEPLVIAPDPRQHRVRVLRAVEEFSQAHYHVDVLKIELPVQPRHIPEFYSRAQAVETLQQISASTPLPHVFLSGGLPFDQLTECLEFAGASGSRFNGVLCGRSIWNEGVAVFAQHGEQALQEWLARTALPRLQRLRQVADTHAVAPEPKMVPQPRAAVLENWTDAIERETAEINTKPAREFDHYDPEHVRDPYAVFEHLRKECPVAHTSRQGGFWILSRYDDVRATLQDHQTFSSAKPGSIALPNYNARDYPVLPIESDPPAHSKYRGMLRDVFTRNEVDRLEPAVRQTANTIIDGFVAHGSCDLVCDFALPLVSHALAKFLKLPVQDADLWVHWAREIFEGRMGDAARTERAVAAMAAYVDELMAARIEQPRDDVFSLLTQARVDGRALSTLELRGYGMLLLTAGREATVDGIDNAMWYLACHPTERAWLRERLDDAAAVRTAVEEFLRFMTPIQLLGRIVTRDTTLHGVTMHQGDSVGVLYSSANRDATEFPEADSCVLDRRRNPHLAFGVGVHTCLGAHLARLDMRIAITEFLRRIPEFALAGEPVWAPNGDTRGFRRLEVEFPVPAAAP